MIKMQYYKLLNVSKIVINCTVIFKKKSTVVKNFWENYDKFPKILAWNFRNYDLIMTVAEFWKFEMHLQSWAAYYTTTKIWESSL